MDSFLWREGYIGATNKKLETLPQQSCDIIVLLEAKIGKWQLWLPLGYFNRNDRYYKKLCKIAEKLKTKDRLDDQTFKHINTAVEILTKP